MRKTFFLRAGLVGAALLALGFSFLTSGTATPAPRLNWYKGNLHTHTVNSDGDSTPNEVASWYKEHRYHFLVLSDHNFLTEIDGLNGIHAAREKFLLIPGEEVTDSFEGRPIHVNAYNPARLVEPPHGSSLVETIQRNVDAIRTARGLPALNHPNFEWAVTAKDILSVKDLSLFEVYNGHRGVNNIGGGGFESLDEMWDAVLTAGKRIYGIAVDDAHHFKSYDRNLANPGRGWVVVRAAALTAEDIIRGLASGNFYASTGVVLKDIQVSDNELRVVINPARGTRQTTFFIGAGGRVLGKSYENIVSYRFQGGEKYVRARVQSSNGDIAWTQPVFPGAN